MATDFPCNLPGVLFANYSNSELEHFRRNDVQSGPPRYELLTSKTPTLFNVTWNFSLFEFQVFEGWFKYQTIFGSSSFNIILPVGKGDEEHECYFNGAYSVNRTGKRIIVEATLIATEKKYDTVCDSQDIELLDRISSSKNKCLFFNQFIDFSENKLPDALETIDYGTDFS